MGCGKSKVVPINVSTTRAFETDNSKGKATLSLQTSPIRFSEEDDVEGKATAPKQQCIEDVSEKEDIDKISQESGGQSYHTLRPPKKRKHDLIPDPAIFRDLDNAVKKTPNKAAVNVETLAKHLMSLGKTELETIRALFCWLAFNISYDVGGYFSGQIQPQKAEAVLQSRKAVCQGYAELFLALSKEAKIECLLVSGIAKGYGYDPAMVLTADTKTDHAWNLVFVHDEWRPLDCTWGAGHLDKDHQFKREFNEHWFLTDPEEFLPKHFPLMDRNSKTSSVYQLMKNSISIEQYSRSASLSSYAYSLGLQLLSHQEVVIDVSHDVSIRMKAGRRPLQGVDATIGERSSSSDAMSKRAGIVTSLDEDGTCTIYVRPPKVATYKLTVMARGAGEKDKNTLHSVVEYIIKCHKTDSNADPMPEKQGLWGLQNPTAAECGLKPPLPFSFNASGGEVEVPVLIARVSKVSARLYHAEQMNEELTGYTFISTSETGALIRARLPRRGYYKLSLFTSHPDQTSLPHVADLLLHADKPCPDCKPFPEIYAFAMEERVQLLQPLIGELSSRGPTLFRLRAPTLGAVQVGETKMELKNDGTWEAEVTPKKGQDTICIYGAKSLGATSLSGLYQYSISL